MVEMVDKMIEAKGALAAARTDAKRNSLERLTEHLDRQIDALVYKLYDINPDEISIIEGGRGSAGIPARLCRFYSRDQGRRY